MRKWMRRIQSKFLLAMLIIGILPILILGLIAFVQSYGALMENHTTYGYTNLEVMDSELNTISRSMIAFSRQLIASDPLKETFSGAADSPSILEKKRMDMVVDSCAILLKEPYVLFILDGAKHYCKPSARWRTDDFNPTSFDSNAFSEADWYRKTVENEGREVFFLQNVLNGNKLCFSMTKLLRDLQTGEPWGMMVLLVRMEALHQMLPVTFTQPGTAYVLIDDDGKSIVLGSAPEKAAFNILEAAQSGTSITKRYSTRTCWTLHYVLDRNIIFRNNLEIISATLLTTAILIIVCIGLSVWLARTITRPLNRLGHAIEEMETTGSVHGYAFDDDEVGQIGKRFLEMSEKIDTLHQNVVQLSVREKEAELKALQMQVNPHFLYNTLTSIYWLCKLNRSEDAAQAAILLSDAFKYSLNRDKRTEILVDEELIQIERYLLLQNILFDGKIHVVWNIEDEVRTTKILKLILQPLVENAIYHGLEPKIGDWELRIEGRMSGEIIEFTVQDNGVGMLPDEIRKGFGASNVEERIRLHYGCEYGCRYESTLGEGTTVTVRIPVVKETENR